MKRLLLLLFCYFERQRNFYSKKNKIRDRRPVITCILLYSIHNVYGFFEFFSILFLIRQRRKKKHSFYVNACNEILSLNDRTRDKKKWTIFCCIIYWIVSLPFKLWIYNSFSNISCGIQWLWLCQWNILCIECLQTPLTANLRIVSTKEIIYLFPSIK